MKWNRVKITIPEFRFCGHLRIVWKLNVNNINILDVYSWTMSRVGVLFFIKNMLRGWFGCIEVTTFKPHIVLLFGHLADSKCFLLFFLIGQSRRNVIYFLVNGHGIVAFHPLVVCNGRFCREHWWIPRYVSFSWERSISHLIIVVRRRSCKKVHPCVAWKRHS